MCTTSCLLVLNGLAMARIVAISKRGYGLTGKALRQITKIMQYEETLHLYFACCSIILFVNGLQ